MTVEPMNQKTKSQVGIEPTTSAVYTDSYALPMSYQDCMFMVLVWSKAEPLDL